MQQAGPKPGGGCRGAKTSREDRVIKIDEDNIETAIFHNAENKPCVRMRDMDSGEVLTIRICNTMAQAIAFYNAN
jgi:hypothetical protein